MKSIVSSRSGIKNLRELTRDWGAREKVSHYLDRCQVDTPSDVVEATWRHVIQLRKSVGKVVDFGAGDGRFCRTGRYASYIGYEIDSRRSHGTKLPKSAKIIHRCAFSDTISDADICIGNPPFVRNQDLPLGWRERVSAIMQARTGVALSGLANAWQYFFLLSLVSAKADGLVALVIPYEWVSRPASRLLREYIEEQRWDVSVYRLVDTTFDSVLTTSSITIVDKSKRNGVWRYFEENASGKFAQLASPSGATNGVIPYLPRSQVNKQGPRAVRGLSPGTQKVLTLTEGERVRFGLKIRTDVVPCITTLRMLPQDVKRLNDAIFREFYRFAGQKCWLIRTDRKPSRALRAYLNAVPKADYQTSTCLERKEWWKFKMPPIPSLLMSMSFRGRFPKGVRNDISARAVGGVCGIFNITAANGTELVNGLKGVDIRSRIVAHSNGLRKIEINQLNSLIATASGRGRAKQ
ncbi:MAG: hypothetical protein AB7V13_06230 [Pseudorhodoplanes sp.]|uniref:Eco57I restriction-modification methylase domain-containing protein n=1 Tax=Pseudorhodoplanes sp. TaxID=1934341 RepID=UPI003D141D0F